MIPYHFFYAAHREQAFNPCDRYSASDAPPDVDALRPGYGDLIGRHVPASLAW